MYKYVHNYINKYECLAFRKRIRTYINTYCIRLVFSILLVSKTTGIYKTCLTYIFIMDI